MKLDQDLIHYLTKEDFRVLTAIEMGMKNHELVPSALIQSIAKLKRANTFKIIQNLLKHKLIMHKNTKCDGYALNYMGYDFLALRVFMKRGHIINIGNKFGMGKESDIYLCETPSGENVIVKLERLGRTSFKAVKNKRDYLNKRTSFSWFYLSRLAAVKEFAFMKALHERGFPTPVPIDYNRHAILMSRVDAYPMTNVHQVINPKEVYLKMLNLVISLAEHGLIHGDFNEFNLMIDDEEVITLIDFPQMISINHPDAVFFFDRDIECIHKYFDRKYALQFDERPRLETDIERKAEIDKEVKESVFMREALGEDGVKELDLVEIDKPEEGEGEGEEQEAEGEGEGEGEPEESKGEDGKGQEEGVKEGEGDEGKDESEGEGGEEKEKREGMEGEGEGKDEEMETESMMGRIKKVVNPSYVKYKIKREARNIKEKVKYKRNANKAKNKGKKKENAYALDHI